MTALAISSLQNYRSQTYRTAPGMRLRTKEDAISYANERGFLFFWPIQGCELPSLWTAVAGDRPVADEHDDPGHVTWGWKDSLLGKGAWYYAKVLRKKATIISLECIPYFYALTENYGSPEEDYLTLYEQGRMTQEAKITYETILAEGPLDTVALRKATRMTSHESDSRFNRALTDLQVNFNIIPIGVAQAGRWNYAFRYDIVTRVFTDLPDRTRFINERQARKTLAEIYFRSVGAAQLRDLTKLFGWSTPDAGRALADLVQAGILLEGIEIENRPGGWYVLRDLTQ